jgi:hypothetical protein
MCWRTKQPRLLVPRRGEQAISLTLQATGGVRSHYYILSLASAMSVLSATALPPRLYSPRYVGLRLPVSSKPDLKHAGQGVRPGLVCVCPRHHASHARAGVCVRAAVSSKSALRVTAPKAAESTGEARH